MESAWNSDAALERMSGRLDDAYFILDVNKTDTLKRAVSLIDDLFRQIDTRSVNSDIMGDIFEYLLEEVKESGKNGQFRTPRHVIRFMVELLKPELGKSVLDPACGSGGFLINCLLYWKAGHTRKNVLRLEWDGTPHDVDPTWPRGRRRDFSAALRGYDNDRTMVRIAWMNLLLHDVESPDVRQLDALSKRLEDSESGKYDYILANPPFTGNVDAGDLSENPRRFPNSGKTTKSELLFVWLMLDLLRVGGRAAVIVPDGVLFGGTIAHRELRRQLLFENTLAAVISLPPHMFQPYSGVKTSILLFQKASAPAAAGSEPRTREVWFYEVSDEAYSLDQKRKALYGQDSDLWDALAKFEAWSRYQNGETEGRTTATATDYYQPDYWEERWRTVDDAFLSIFPEKKADNGRTYPLHELWKDLPFDPADSRGARQYDDAVLDRVRPKLEKVVQRLVQQTLTHFYATERQPDAEKALAAAEKNVRTLSSQLLRTARDGGLLDRDFDQFGWNALKALLKEVTAQVKEWVAATSAPVRKPNTAPAKPDVDRAVGSLAPLFTEFAKLDGYNVWRRSRESKPRAGKLVSSGESGQQRRPAVLSWTVPVRQWAELEVWGEDPETKQRIERPTHKDGAVDPAYLTWLRDTLKVFNDDATVKRDFLDRLTPDCLEAVELNLSAGRHKPFTFDPGQHRPPTSLIVELQTLHGEIQRHLGRLLAMVGGGE